MYEGKNIHFSPLDNKPLCSYSAKVCKQRRLNGYSLCLRHVLEDPGAPFRQCLYQARNKQQCTNPIHKNNDAQFCTSHLQLLGLIPVGVKSCSKANRDGKQLKNGLHGSSPCQKDSPQIKVKVGDGVCSLSEAQSSRTDPYTFSDIDLPKTSKSSPPLLSMVADVSGIKNCIAAICPAGTKPPVLPEPSRSIPISRLYPELVEKLESDGNRFQPRTKTGRSLRTANALQSRNSQSRVKLKKNCSPLSGVLASDSGECQIAASSLSTLLSQPLVSSSSPPTSTNLLTSPPSTPLDLTNDRALASNNSSSETQSAGLISRSQWMLPVFEPLVQQQTMPVMQTISKALHGLLNPLPLLKSSLQQHFAGSSLLQSVAHNPLLRSRSEPQRAIDKGFLLCQSSNITSAAVNQCHTSVDPQEADSLAVGSLGALFTKTECSLVPEKTSAISETQPHATSAVTETTPTLCKTLPNSEKAFPGSGMINYVRPRAKVCRISDKEAKSRIRRKSAQKIYLEHVSRVMENSHLLPTGVDSSDDDDDLDDELPWQRLWNDLSSDEGERDFDLAEDVASNIRRTKLQLLKSKMRRQFTQLQRCHEGNSVVRWRRLKSMDYLIASCRQDIGATVEALRSIRNIKSTNSSSYRSNSIHHQRKRPCLHRNDNDEACQSVALPYTNHCLKHIMYNVDQMLFGYCTAKFADKTQCCVPVFDIRHELPLCPDHVNREIALDSQELKPKKQRKKTKPSALTRPPKKGKKKKCQRKTLPPQKPLLMVDGSHNNGEHSVEVQFGAMQQASMFSSASSSLPSSVGTAQVPCLPSSDATGSSTLLSGDALSKDSMDEDTLGSDLDVTFSPGGLPLDNDQATNFLDDHELHEMLNKMADEAFNLSSGKNGGYPSSKEVEEEFVRALVEVTKTLNESKETRLDQLTHDHDGLATLLPDGGHEDELTKQIADSLLNRHTLSPAGSIMDDQDNLSDLASSLTAHDLKSISQVMVSSIMNHALELCPATISLPSPGDGHSLPISDNSTVSYLNGSGLLPPLYSRDHPIASASSFLPVVDQSQLGSTDSNLRGPSLLSFPMTSNGLLETGISSQHTPSIPVTATPLPPQLPPVLPVLSSPMLPNAVGVSSAPAVASVGNAVPSLTLRLPRSGDDCFLQSFQSLPDIQTLMKQPWRLGETPPIADIRPNSVTVSTTLVPVNFLNSQFSYMPGFHPSQFLVPESKVVCPVLQKVETEGIQPVIAALTETNAASTDRNHYPPPLSKILSQQTPSTP